MSEYGLRIRDSSGNITLDTTSRMARLRYTQIATAGQSGSVNLPDIALCKTVEISFALSDSGVPHYVKRNGTEIEWTPPDTGASVNSAIFVFVYT